MGEGNYTPQFTKLDNMKPSTWQPYTLNCTVVCVVGRLWSVLTNVLNLESCESPHQLKGSQRDLDTSLPGL